MPTWREFQANRRAQTREFFRRHKRMRWLHALLFILIVVPVIATILFLDYGDSLGLPVGAPRYQAALGAVIVAGVTILLITGTLAVARWREESRITEAFVALGFVAIPVIWWIAATCVLDIVADGPTTASCSSGTVDIVFGGMAWMVGWVLAGPIVDFLRLGRNRPLGSSTRK